MKGVEDIRKNVSKRVNSKFLVASTLSRKNSIMIGLQNRDEEGRGFFQIMTFLLTVESIKSARASSFERLFQAVFCKIFDT